MPRKIRSKETYVSSSSGTSEYEEIKLEGPLTCSSIRMEGQKEQRRMRLRDNLSPAQYSLITWVIAPIGDDVNFRVDHHILKILPQLYRLH